MGLSNPRFDAFRLYLPKDFVLSKTRDVFENYFKLVNLPYADMADYINSTIINAKLPGLIDKGTSPQQVEKGGNVVQTFKSGLIARQWIDKKLRISFHLKESYLNWVMLYQNMLNYLNDKDDIIFMPNVYLQIMDEMDNIIIEIVYKEIQIREVSDIDFSTKSVGISSKEFDMVLAFNDFDVVFHYDKIQSTRKSALHEY